MSDRPRGDRPVDDDPFAFPSDDAGSAGDGPAGAPPAGSAGADDPFAFPEDAHDAGDATDDGTPTPVPVDRSVVEREEAARAARRQEAADQASANARRVGARWLAFAAVVFVVLLVVTRVTGGDGAEGGDVAAGERLPEFAAPLATRPRLENEDVNLASEDGQGEAGRFAACSIRNASVVTSCGLLARGPLVVMLFSRGLDACVRAVDDLDAERRRFPRVQTLAVSLLGRHDSTAETVRDRRWTLPVVYDRDGGLASVLGAPACPLVLFVRQDGTVAQRIIGDLEPGELARGMEALTRPVPTATTPAPAATTP
jgi:hypothetical protein